MKKGPLLADPFSFLIPIFRISSAATKRASFYGEERPGRPLESADVTLVQVVEA